MRIGYLDCFSGVSGDMLVGAMLDAGAPLEALVETVRRLRLDGVRLDAERVRRAGIAATRFVVRVPRRTRARHLPEILERIESAGLPPSVAERARRTFRRLGEAEAFVHGVGLEEVHFHEVGADDTIVDVVCACAALDLLGVDRLYSSAVATGRGTVECDHGTMPVPAPGTLACLRGIPIRTGGPEAELATPTGAALLATLVDEFEPCDLTWSPRTFGHGAGARDVPGRANVLRLTLGHPAEAAPAASLVEITCNLDTATGEELADLLQGALDRGAVDAFVTPATMKKGRPGHVLSVLVDAGHRDEVCGYLLEESTTLGLRMHRVERCTLPRFSVTVETELGPVRCKTARLPSGREVTRPEDDEVRRLCSGHGMARADVLALVYAALRRS